MLTAGVDLAAQPSRTGAVVVDWSGERPGVVLAALNVENAQIVELCRAAAGSGGRVGVDCPFGWPRAFREFITAHAEHRRLPGAGPSSEALRLRATDLALRERFHRAPLSVSTDLLGVTAIRAARIFAELDEAHMPVDRTGSGTVCEVYPAASRRAWGLAIPVRDLPGLLEQLPLTLADAECSQLGSEHVFDALLAALTARAVALHATAGPPPECRDLAAEEGWIHVPAPGHRLRELCARSAG